jgi:chemotaxis protein methyltransferase CheR
MNDDDCVAFLRWALPRLALRYKGYRKVRRQVRKRISRRMKELGLSNAEAYRDYLDHVPEEWPHLDGLCRITISRFYRDKGTFDILGEQILPELAAASDIVRCWSAGCGSGEEAYTLAILWHLQDDGKARLRLLATDADDALLARAAEGCYAPGTLKDVPESWFGRALAKQDGLWRVQPDCRTGVAFRQGDIRAAMPDGPFDLVLCRNLAFTYFEAGLQRKVLDGIVRRLRPGGYLVIGRHEHLPEGVPALSSLDGHHDIFRHCTSRELGRHRV